MSENSKELPRYKCHKIVHALKIVQIDSYPSSHIVLHFSEEEFSPENIFEHSNEFNRFTAREGDDLGYYIVYEDGYISWSPTKAFEEGYTRI